MKQFSSVWTGFGRLSAPAVVLTLTAGCAAVSPPGASDQAVAPAPAVTAPPAVAAAPVAAPRAVAPRALAPRVPPSDTSAASIIEGTSGPLAAEPHADLWARMRAGFSLPELDTPLVQEKERFYLSNRNTLNLMFARGGRYLHYIMEEVERRGMPAELALLPFVESAMNPVALSSAKAAGLWQFIPSTGKQYELSQNWWVDNRRDVVKSTNAALDYLQKIYEMNERDWFLALASYNWGENAVARAVKNNRARGLPVDYLSLSMPAETRHYVPKLMALKNIVMRADELGLVLPAVPNKPYFVTIEKTRPIDLKLAAQFANMSVDEFVALNPAHNRPVIAASKNNQIKLPADRVDLFLASMARHDLNAKPLASWQPYTLKQGESLDEVARRGNVSTHELLKANGLRSAGRIMPGTQVIAPQETVHDERQVESFQGPRVYEQVTLPAVYHRVQRRESLAGIAGSYGVSADTLRAWNGGMKAPRPGSIMLVRPASNQTILTTASGERQVVSRGEPAAVTQPVLASNEPVAAPVAQSPRTEAAPRIEAPRAAPVAAPVPMRAVAVVAVAPASRSSATGKAAARKGAGTQSATVSVAALSAKGKAASAPASVRTASPPNGKSQAQAKAAAPAASTKASAPASKPAAAAAKPAPTKTGTKPVRT